jgi:hypothetical protein
VRVLAGALLALGLLQMAGDVAGLPALRAVGAAWQASPAPRELAAVHGLETYAARVGVEWTDRGGVQHVLPLTPEVLARLRGPSHRRAAYRTALVLAPVLAGQAPTRPMWEAVARHALCGDAPLLRELGATAPPRPGAVRVRLSPRPGPDPGPLPRVLAAPCP